MVDITDALFFCLSCFGQLRQISLLSRNYLNFFNWLILFYLSNLLLAGFLGQRLSFSVWILCQILGNIFLVSNKNYQFPRLSAVFIYYNLRKDLCQNFWNYFINLKEMSANLLKSIVSIFPPLSAKNIKGESGRIAVVGGSYEFSGAPFYSAISALKVGGDLGHIFCNKASATAIKTYSPQIIVHPIFVSDEQTCFLPEGKVQVPQIWMHKIMAWSKAINVWIVGPGLGRDLNIADFFPTLVKNLPEEHIVVFNADGIYHLCKHPQLLEWLPKFRKTVLLTNHKQLDIVNSYTRLNILSKDILNYKTQGQITQITPIASYPNYTVILKGRKDYILGKRSFICDIEGGKKRCNGIGDILAGVVGVCTFWDQDLGPLLASKITKQATKTAFNKYGRSLTATSIIEELPRTVIQLQRFHK